MSEIKDGTFRVTRITKNSAMPMKEAHSHSQYEMYYIISGKRKFFIDDSIYNVKAGDLIFITKDTLHRSVSSDDDISESISVVCEGKYFNELFSSYGFYPIMEFYDNVIYSVGAAHREYMLDIFKRMEYETKSDDPHSVFMLKNYINEFFVLMMRSRDYHKNFLTEENSIDDLPIQEAAEYIKNNFDKDITLESVSQRINMSKTYFSKKFLKITGFGFKEYLINIRLKEAAVMLIDTDLSINEIAEKCGFRNSNYFGDVFRKFKGVSPSVYRKERIFE